MSSKPIWTEGLLLSQHHFQQQDKYHEALLRERLQAITHYDWGVIALEIDEMALVSGQFKVLRLQAIWPDGASICCGHGAEDSAPSPRAYGQAFAPESSRLEVYVGLANDNEGIAAVAESGEVNSHRRYISATRRVPDLNTANAHQEVEIAGPNLRLFFGNERQDGFTSIRVAELVRQSNGQPILRDNYVPPVLRISAAPFLQQGLQRVLTGICARQRELSSERRQRESRSVAFHSEDAKKFWLLHTLNGAIPGISHLCDTDRAHPEEAYQLLVQLAGQLCTFAPDIDPLGLPKFNYLALGDIFEELFARILSLLPGGVEQAFIEVGLEHRKDGMLLGKFPEPNLAGHEFFVAVQSNLPESIVRERVPAILKMAAWNEIYDVVKQARHGVRTEIEWNPTPLLPLKPGVCFFRVRREGSFWEGIARTSTVAMHLPVDPDWADVGLSLYAVDPKKLR